ncbi:MAG: hypothetical protein WAV93_04840 [Bacteroidales bacterium]
MMNFIKLIKAVIIFLLMGIPVAGLAQEEYCCRRILMFPSFPMPEGQERDLSLGISVLWNSMTLKAGAHELEKCPIPLELRSWEGNMVVDSMLARMAAAVQKTQPKFQSDEESRKGADYIWKGKLELLSVDTIVPGEWDDAYIDEDTKPGTKRYEPGNAIGKWRFTIQLYNPFWNEVVKEASTPEYEGTGDHDESHRKLYTQHFANLKEIILEYEKAPKKAEFESEVIKVDPERTKRITFRVTDEKGEKPKKWQRLAVKVDFGTLTNGTPCCEMGEDAKFYSFMCEEGQVTIEYKAPDPDKATFDHITVFNGCIIQSPDIIAMSMVDIQEEIGAVNIALVNEGYSGTVTITKSWDYVKQYDDHASTYTGSQTININGTFKPIPEMEGMEGQPIKIFGKGTVYGTWKHNARRYCEGKGCGDCPGLMYDESGSGSVPKMVLDAMIITTMVLPTDNKVVADQLKQFGMDNFYDIMIPGEYVDTQRRIRSDHGDEGCQWSNSASFTTLTDCMIRYKVTDIKHLYGRASWSSKSDSNGLSITDLTEAIYDQPPYDPEQNGTDYTYTITWNLKAR